jgi:hypothetical protein
VHIDVQVPMVATHVSVGSHSADDEQVDPSPFGFLTEASIPVPGAEPSSTTPLDETPLDDATPLDEPLPPDEPPLDELEPPELGEPPLLLPPQPNPTTRTHVATKPKDCDALMFFAPTSRALTRPADVVDALVSNRVPPAQALHLP